MMTQENGTHLRIKLGCLLLTHLLTSAGYMAMRIKVAYVAVYGLLEGNRSCLFAAVDVYKAASFQLGYSAY